MHLAFTPLWKSWVVSEGGAEVIEMSDKDQDALRELPRKEYIVDDQKALLVTSPPPLCPMQP